MPIGISFALALGFATAALAQDEGYPAGTLVPEVDLDIIADQLRFDSVRDARLVTVELQSIDDNLTLNI